MSIFDKITRGKKRQDHRFLGQRIRFGALCQDVALSVHLRSHAQKRKNANLAKLSAQSESEHDICVKSGRHVVRFARCERSYSNIESRWFASSRGATSRSYFACQTRPQSRRVQRLFLLPRFERHHGNVLRLV